MKDNKNLDSEEIEQLTQKIFDLDEETRKYEDRVRKELEDEEATLRQKMAMEDASRFIQRKWDWFQKVGKFLVKKRKKGKKGGKKKKK